MQFFKVTVIACVAALGMVNCHWHAPRPLWSVQQLRCRYDHRHPGYGFSYPCGQLFDWRRWYHHHGPCRRFHPTTPETGATGTPTGTPATGTGTAATATSGTGETGTGTATTDQPTTPAPSDTSAPPSSAAAAHPTGVMGIAAALGGAVLFANNF
ncbi:hypothetical protein PG994_011665 [Apiospora phragmitis]|uniref:Uncharacterized protein n=1 Tax=Apiospora phragmitis TaxID=2905665 RepID=A0ABR1TTF5_9PEZI